MDLPESPVFKLHLADDDLGKYLLGYYIAAQAADLDIPADQIMQDFAEQVRQHVLTLESQTASNAALEKALHKAAGGDFETAGRLFRELVDHGVLHIAALDEWASGRRRQKANAKRPRTDALSGLISRIFDAKPDITETELLAELRKREREGVIEEISDDEIYYIQNDQSRSAAISGLKNRLYRLRQKQRKNTDSL